MSIRDPYDFPPIPPPAGPRARQERPSIAVLASALGLRPQVIRGELSFRCPGCQQRDLADVDWPARDRPHFVAELGEGPGVVVRGHGWRCLLCGRRGTAALLRRWVEEDPAACERLERLLEVAA